MFEQENKFFEEKKFELLKYHEGKYALIKGSDLHGIFDTDRRAFEVGVEKFGLQSFMIKHILEKDEAIRIPAYSLGVINAHP